MTDRNPFSGAPVGAKAFEDTDDNPFENGRSAAAASGQTGSAYDVAPSRPSRSAGAVRAVAASSQPPQDSFPGMSDEDLRLREENLKRREQQLEEREKGLEARETAIRNNPSMREPNWPSRCYPITYHDISVQVPPPDQPMVRRFYALVIITWLALIFNWMIFLIAYFASSIDVSTDVLWSSIYMVMGIPGSWKCWYLQVYEATGSHSNAKWVVFFITFFIHWVLTILISVAVPSCNGAGLLFMLKCFSNGWNAGGVLALINTGVWGLMLLASTYLGKRAYSVWRGAGGAERLEKEAAVAKAMGSVALNVANAPPAEGN